MKVILTVLLLSLLIPIHPWSQIENAHYKIDKFLSNQFDESEENDFLIVFDKQIRINAKTLKGTKTEKANFVFRKLIDHSKTEQKEVIKYLDKQSITYHSFYIVNAIQLKGTKEVAIKLASFENVSSIIADPYVNNNLPLLSNSTDTKDPGDPEWGILQIGADHIWELGFKGSGVIIGGQDTGYEWHHSTIKDKYRGWLNGKANHNYNWHDAIKDINPLHNDSLPSPENNPCGLNINIPCDDHGHGTHTMGTMVGENDNNKIGVAPEAQWIGCRNMERGFGKPSTYIECFEWFLAPTDTLNLNPNPTLAPHVINNSWSCPELEGCNSSNWLILELAVNNLRASGVVVVVSAGNLGPLCGNINTPAAMFDKSLTVGASDQSNNIAGFSSWGPVTVDQSLRLKPDLVAPGVGVRSSFPGEEYRTWNGTSMAGPHVAGAVALMISANPDLAGDVEAIESILKTTADELYHEANCGDFLGQSTPNPMFGYGIINLDKAIAKSLAYQKPVSNSFLVTSELYPNPVDDYMFLETQGIRGPSIFTVHNITGKLLITKNIDLELYSRFKVSLPNFTRGIYYYVLRQGNNVIHSGKFVKY
jgi:subtilisin family serine protease